MALARLLQLLETLNTPLRITIFIRDGHHNAIGIYHYLAVKGIIPIIPLNENSQPTTATVSASSAATAPTAFEPEKMIASIDMLLTLQPQRLYMTHFGAVNHIQKLTANMRETIGQFVSLAQGLAGTDPTQREQKIFEGMQVLVAARLDAHGCQIPKERILEILLPDITLNAKGLNVWLAVRRKKRRPEHRRRPDRFQKPVRSYLGKPHSPG